MGDRGVQSERGRTAKGEGAGAESHRGVEELVPGAERRAGTAQTDKQEAAQPLHRMTASAIPQNLQHNPGHAGMRRVQVFKLTCRSVVLPPPPRFARVRWHS